VAVHTGASITPSRLMNSCTWIPTAHLLGGFSSLGGFLEDRDAFERLLQSQFLGLRFRAGRIVTTEMTAPARTSAAPASSARW
jgi:hypothetical protein